MSRRFTFIALTALGAVLISIGVVRACGLDGVPSLSVNGRIVARSVAAAGDEPDSVWAPFVTTVRFTPHRPVVFAENRVQVAASLPPSGFAKPWRWHFGDGTGARGMTIEHVYQHRGTYIVTVDAYVVAGTLKEWITFDRAAITVR